MFPKGPRFNPPKISDVPGPNAYTIPKESQLDNYKRGAFLEKTDRFTQEKTAPAAPLAKPSAPTNKVTDRAAHERYQILQKKVEELERVHLEDKKIHQVELAKQKEELVLYQKLASENAERFEKQKMQTTLLETRLQDIKKASLSDQSELKELRHKVRLLELERDKASSKQPEIMELKKALAALEVKRKEELKERDKRIHDNDNLIQTERKKRVSLEKKVDELTQETTSLKAAARQFETRIQEAKELSRNAAEAVTKVQSSGSDRENVLIQQVDQLRSLLQSAAEQYGNLVAHSVPAIKHDALQREFHASQLRQVRLERKLANSEGQVIELTHLIRQIRQQNSELHHQLYDTVSEIACLATFKDTPFSEDALPLYDLCDDILRDQLDLVQSDLLCEALLSTYHRLRSEGLHALSSEAIEAIGDLQRQAEQCASDLTSTLASHEAIASRLESIRKQNLDLKEQFESADILTAKLKSTIAGLEAQLSEVREELAAASSRQSVAVKKERDIINRLTATVQKNRAAEDALRAEIEQLTSELSDAERYQEAYLSLSEEVANLITRNQICEEESERISKFNAEILGHNNPAQRIMYVDRIRRELAEAKHTIALLSREQDDLLTQKEDLQREVDMYKSVQVPVHHRPRTHVTRIARPPLGNLEMNSSTAMEPIALAKSSTKALFSGSREGDMTIDELT
ncbi:hypothetical protein CPC08DRAFT_749306 [Agrocybe pediades]|nr:hypothetical protein CPC08DRAFT_749306 [Agrocybe pediades]